MYNSTKRIVKKEEMIMKKKILVLTISLMIVMTMLSACGKKEENASDPQASVETESADNEKENIDNQTPAEEQKPDEEQTGDVTIANELKEMFLSEIETTQDIEEIATALGQSPKLAEMSFMNMPVSPGYLNGFQEEISGFNNGVMFSPMIGSIPFVGYIFETDTPDELVATLEEKAMLNWNICTTADEMVTAVSENYVFFVMAPYSFE